MASRMDKYNEVNSTSKKRTLKNEDLYRKIYDQKDYNIDDVKKMDSIESIDINKIKDMLKRNDKPIRVKCPEVEYAEIEEGNYDINQLLSKAKDNKKIDGYQGLIETDDVFKELREKRKKELAQEGESEDDLKDLINTITNRSVAKRFDKTEIGLDLLDDLKSDDSDELATKDSIKLMLQQAKNEESKNTVKCRKVDTAFYTSGLKFKTDDFEEIEGINDSVKKNSILIKIVLFIICTLIALGLIYFVFNLLK